MDEDLPDADLGWVGDVQSDLVAGLSAEAVIGRAHVDTGIMSVDVGEDQVGAGDAALAVRHVGPLKASKTTTYEVVMICFCCFILSSSFHYFFAPFSAQLARNCEFKNVILLI